MPVWVVMMIVITWKDLKTPQNTRTRGKRARFERKRLEIDKAEPLLLFGFNDIYLKRIESAFSQTQITARGNQVLLKGEDADLDSITRILEELTILLNRNGNLTENDVETVLALFSSGDSGPRNQPQGSNHTILFTPHGGSVKAKTPNQAKLLNQRAVTISLSPSVPRGRVKHTPQLPLPLQH